MSLKIKKLVNTVLVGATILGGAITMQSFGEKEVTVPVKNQQMRYWANINGEYVEVTSVNPVTNCSSGSPEECVLQSTDNSIPSSFGYSEIADYENLEKHPLSSQGDYNP